MLKSLFSYFFISSLLLSGVCYGIESKELSPEEKGLHIASRAKQHDMGWGDSQSEIEMILRNKYGQESRRVIRNKNLEVEGDGDKSLVIFDEPRDVKGAAFLNFSHPVGADDQWLYLPALKRIKRISSRNKSSPFMGSEFAYEDMSSFEVEKYTYKFLREEKVDGRDCYVSEYYPVDKYSGYPRQIVWLDKVMNQPIKTEFYDRRNSLLKTLVNSEYALYEDKYWRPDRMEMTNHLNGKSTILVFKNYRFRTGLNDRNFNQNSLKRAR